MRAQGATCWLSEHIPATRLAKYRIAVADLHAAQRATGAVGRFVFVLAAMLSVFQLWQPLAGFVPPGVLPLEHIFGLQPATYFRPTHLAWILTIGFFVYPLRGLRWLDLASVVAVLWASTRVLGFNYQSLDHLLHGLQSVDFIAGLILVVATLEMARRSVGPVLMIVGLVFILYAAFGNHLPDAIAVRGFSFERIVRFQVFTNAGLFGAPLGIAAGAVFSFVLFGAFLQNTGAGKFLIDLSFAAAGRFRGGPAKASVIASAAMGSISGSAIANTVTTGSLTIPMMKKLGYKPAQAAGIEAAASTGGQIMPPIMGAGAFVMAEFTRTAYSDIVWMSLAPAVLYFLSVLLYVHILAAKSGLKGLKNTTAAWSVLQQGAQFLLPIIFVTVLLLRNYSPVLVGVAGVAAVLVAGMLRAHTRIGPGVVADALYRGAVMAIPISIACAVAGIVVGTIGQTGIGLQFTESVIGLSNGQLWLALLLVAAAALVLGMGLPATAAYIVLAVMTGPALQELGLALITAHMIIFWLAQTSNVTPPIALAAFAGAGIAGAPPMRSAVAAFKLANGLFVIPLMMAYTPLLLNSDNTWIDVAQATAVTFALVVAIAIGVERYLFTVVSPTLTAISLAAALLLVAPFNWSRGLGVAACLVVLIINFVASRKLRDT
ncbi:MAG: TRAP transporter fused permease subunit [Woeseiaceae bacterium]|nr:TRAP transporter fused permease subunit [Woeseiaceae bacterium]